MRLLINRARHERRGKVLPFKKPAPKRAPYQPCAANGECYAIKSQLVEYDADGNEVAVGCRRLRGNSYERVWRQRRRPWWRVCDNGGG